RQKEVRVGVDHQVDGDMQGVYALAPLLDVFIRGMFALEVRIEKFASIRESRKRFAKAGQFLTTHDAIAGGKSHFYEMLEEGMQSRQEFAFADAIAQGKHAA